MLSCPLLVHVRAACCCCCCSHFPAKGFPRVKLLNKGATKAHDYKGLSYKVMTQTLKDPSKWKFDIDTGFGGGAGKAEL